MGRVLQITGGVLQVAGVITLAFGITQTRKAFSPERDWWWIEWWGWIVTKAQAVWRRLTRRGQKVSMHVAASMDVALSVNPILSHTHWPDDEAERWEEVRVRTDRNLKMVQEVGKRVADHGRELASVRREIEEARADLETQSEQEVRRLAATGLRTESRSVFLIGLGLALSTWGTFLGS